MEVRITCTLCLCFLLGCGTLSAFNLDTVNVLRKNGEPDSLFGFSLAMHWQLKPENKKMLLVGAPRAKALPGQKSKVTGGLYYCDTRSQSTTCARATFDNTEDLQIESKENQWMGVSVSSQGPGGKILTCAHRYEQRTAVNKESESRAIIGRCYMLGQDLKISPSGVGGDGGSWYFCNGRNKGHEAFGSCQQGVAAIFDDNFHYLIFGAPGAYNWKGIVRLEQRNETLVEMGIYQDGPFELGDENEKNPELVPAPPNSYVGFALDSGMSLTEKDQLTVVAGAPRANLSGAVLLLKIVENSKKVVLDQYTLEGEGLASSFGYAVAVLDFNGDGWQDIVVGAPQYFEKEKEIGGAVYVYINKGGKWDEVTPIRIDGPQDSMFGLAVTNLGDINQDGYQDFAVGAPNHNNGIGSVYIYHGSASNPTSIKAVQILSGKSLGMLKMFGYSLAANMDLDENSYPDLAVGSLSDAVFVYKARPVIKIQKVITFRPKEINLTKKNCESGFCFIVEACFSYTANPPSYSPELTVSYSFEADVDHRKNGLITRVTFPDNVPPENNFESKGTVLLNIKGKQQCVQRNLTMQDKIRDKLHGIPIDVSVEIVDGKRNRRQIGSLPAPVLDPNEPNPTRSVMPFLKEGCRGKNVCDSNLQVECRYGYKYTNEDTFDPLRMEDKMPVISLSDQKDIALEVKVTNKNGDDAHEASIVVLLPHSLTYTTYTFSPERHVSCSVNDTGTEVECELGNPFKSNAETTFYIILGTAGISLDTTDVEISLEPKTTSIQNKELVKAKARVEIVLQLSLTGLVKPSQVYFSEGESAMKSESDAGSAIAHQFRIINLGKHLTDLGTASLEIEWPKANQMLLLQLVNISATGLQKIECSPKDLQGVRTKRAAKSEEKASQLIKKHEILSCDSRSNCVTTKCLLHGLDSNAVITMTSHLRNKTFIEKYSSLNYVGVIVKASLIISGTIRNTKLQNAETEVRLTVFPDRRLDQYRGVPWWVIVLSILFGLLLLALLAFLLWKCGVFEKKNKEDPSEKERLTNA